MREGSAVEIGLPASVPVFRSSSAGFCGAAEMSGDFGGSAPDGEKLSRSGSTSVMSVSEFYGPSGARMLQRRESTASQVSLADSYGEGEAAESASIAREESREGTAALTLLMAEGGEQPQPPLCDTAGVAVGEDGGGGSGERKGAPKGSRPQTPQPSPRVATPDATGSRAPSPSPPFSWPAQGQPIGEAAAVAAAGGGVGGEASRQEATVGASPPGAAAAAAAPAAAVTPSPAGGAQQTAEGERGEKAQAGGSSSLQSAEAAAAGAAAVATAGVAAAAVVAAQGANGVAPHDASSVSPSPGGGANGDPGGNRALLPPPPLTLESPHPCARASGSATAPSASAGNRPRPGGALGVNGVGNCDRNGSPASSMSLTWSSAAAASALPVESLGDAAQKQNQRVGIPRAMSVDSAPASARVSPHSLTVGTQGLGWGAAGVSSGSEAFEISASGGTGDSAGVGANGGSSVARTVGGALHSPRLRAKSMDSGGRKGKSKRGKGPGAAVMGKADRIGRMLQVCT